MVYTLGQRRMEQLKVSMAAVKSRRKIVRKPESEERRRLLVTFCARLRTELRLKCEVRWVLN